MNMKTNNHVSNLARLPVKRLACTALTAIALPYGAHAAEPGMYAGVHLGQNITHGWPATVDFGGGVRSGGGLNLDNGAHFGVFGGQQTANARFELEYQKGRIKVSDAHLGPISGARSGTGDYDVLMANAYRTFDLNPQWNAYAALGLGYAKVKMPGLDPLAGCNCFRAASDSGFAYQARVGTEYQFGSGHRVFVQYTALRLPGASNGDLPSVSYPHKTIGAVTAGYRKTF
jgi:opacity protein-like surface antigen